MKERIKIGEVLKGDTRLEGESYEEYKQRRKLEKSLLIDYMRGVFVPNKK